ncbi:1-phosphatidylinositol 4,5-bisphosphate phosphodiesterase delta-4 [Periophthalmus magnuspinnatus]|uniref:1-phosphatidylinositol 4,5-bisphosphate phosphodiesterase delta-4 n=1 Tax=Periophthalmus magnuspinnatus TaxID=409849 RepID=UPI00145A902B|nr:1-phosphatidylinositol 4,5-bisphosphate phosphodiesterase delta-4 [Periophthalmus magnuspinnatus]
MDPPVTCLHDDPDIKLMMAGSTLRKVKSRSWKKQRHFRLLEDGLTIWYKSRWAGRGHSTFSVSDLETVREGHQSELLLSLSAEFPPEQCFTLVFHGRQGTLDLVAETPNEAKSWIQGIQKLIHKSQNMDEKERLDQWVRDWFTKADKNRDGQMTFKEAKTLLKMMNVEMNEEHALHLFTMSDKLDRGCLDMEEFVLFYKLLTQRDEVWKVFQDFSADGERLLLDELQNFLRVEQQETEERAKDMILLYEPSDTAREQMCMSLDGFQLYLCSPHGSILNPGHVELQQDMSLPLSHYFISSSHNTYLMEDQLRGQSSTEAYIQALKRGCRCVELDCWDGPDGEPVVYHGHTLTSKILFKDVISTLSEYAFKVSEFPVILSLENHCGVEQQSVMARHLKSILGEALQSSLVTTEEPEVLPSPQDLKGKILLKAKKLSGLEQKSDETLTDEVSEEEENGEMERESVEDLTKEESANKKKSKLSRELSDLVVYCRSVHFHGFEHAKVHGKCYEISSFSESKAKKLSKESGSEMVRFNVKQLTRVYPSGLRTDSSNYNPQDMWSSGCQIVALNFQTAGLEMDLNDAVFRQNRGCGFVLKPEFMRKSDSEFSPDRPESRPGHRPLRLSVQVISGQQFPKVNQKEGSIVDPLVRVEIYGVPKDQSREETRYIHNNGFNPVWNESLNFVVHCPELALVRFVVEDYDKASRNDFIGQFTLPFTSLQPGYRHVHLLSRDGTAIPPASVFVNVSVSEHT